MTDEIDLIGAIPDTVETGTDIIGEIPRAFVYVAEKLGSVWEIQEYLYVDSLRINASPAVDEARLVYEYGPMLRENDSEDNPSGMDLQQYDPLDLLNKYCKIVIEGAGQDEEDILWYGIIETDHRIPAGSVKDEDAENENEGNPRGKQEFTAFGIVRLLELTPIMSAHVANPASDGLPTTDGTWRIGEGLAINGERKAGEYDDRGNRTLLPNDDTQEYTFAERTQGGYLWVAYEAVQYVLTYHQPLDSEETPLCDWKLEADPDSLNWYDVTVKTDGQSVKDVLDDLISRKRGLGWYLTFSEDDGPNGTATINVFSFNDAPITLEDSTIPANPDLKKLDFENAFDVECALTNSVSQQYTQVIAVGAFRTTTCTLSFADTALHIEPDWSADDETTFKAGASGVAGYGALPDYEKWKRNRDARADETLKHVYKRFRIHPAFPQWIVGDLVTGSDATEYAVAPKVTDTLINNDGKWDPHFEIGEDTETIWNRGVHLEPKLTLKDRSDYTGTKIRDKTFDRTTAATDDDGKPNWEFLKPLFFVAVGTVGGFTNYRALDKLNESAIDENDLTKWTVSAKMLEGRGAFDLSVSGAPQMAICPTRWVGAAATDPSEDPSPTTNPGMMSREFETFFATLTMRIPARVQSVQTVQSPEEPAGKPVRTLYIKVPDARLDYVVPGTIVNIQNGSAQPTSTGGFVRDDRKRLVGIASAAAQWYGRTRQSIDLTVKQLREVVKLGWLITDVGPNYQIEHVNTPITSISYDFTSGKTSFQTAFATLEFSVAGE